MDSFSGYIKGMRVKSGLSLRDVAMRLNVSATYYTDVEKGRRHPMDIEKLMQFGSITGMTQEEINRMLDLAGRARGTVAPDVAAYITENQCVGAALRIARDVQAECVDWERFAEMLTHKYKRTALEE